MFFQDNTGQIVQGYFSQTLRAWTSACQSAVETESLGPVERFQLEGTFKMI